jgi:anti-sigma B factor antagonist
MFSDFTKRNIGDIILEKINVLRISEKEALNFQSRLDEEISKGNKKFIFDLSSCKFVSSTFLGVLITFAKKINSLEGELEIVSPKEPTLQFIYDTRLDKLFNLFNTVEDALESFKF